MDRRSFLRLGAAAAILPERLLADPYAPRPPVRRGAPARVRGRVVASGRGLGGVAVTDGRAVALTDADGSYELLSSAERDFAYLTVPRGYRIPTSESGTARFYQRLARGPGADAEASWTLEPLAYPDDRHRLLLLADPQTENELEMARFHDETVPDVVGTIAEQRETETVGIACGDIMYDRLELFPEYERGVALMGVPFYQVVGNHDLDLQSLTDEASIETFSARFGPRHYSFDRGAVHYVVLDDVFWIGHDYIGYLDHDQLLWLANDLAHVEPGRTVIVATHIPVLGGQHLRLGRQTPADSTAITNREALYRLLEPFNAHVLVGHTHEHEHVFEGGVHEHVHGTVCGAWWSGPVCWDGTPNGYAVYEIDGEDVTWRYKATGMPSSIQMRLYLPEPGPEGHGGVLANIWDWDPEWRVVWYEDGQPRGQMRQRPGLDPLSVQLHDGPDLPARRTWVDPQPTDHLFYAEPASTALEVLVEATDRFGRTYSETIRLD